VPVFKSKMELAGIKKISDFPIWLAAWMEIGTLIKD
jgi:hypothetical protein